MAGTEDAVRRFLAGDKEAFTWIVRRWEKKVYNLAWRLLGNKEDAQDIAQETFLSVFKSIGNLREPKSFSTWLYRITLNHCRARWRYQVADISLDDRPPGVAGGDNVEYSPGIVSRDAADSLITLDLIRKALMKLSEDQRTAIVLKEYLGLTLEEVASIMDCPLSTAKSRLYQGLRDMQCSLKRMGVRF